MVLVTVGQNDTSHAILVGEKIRRVRNDEVYSGHVDIGKTRAAIDDENIAGEFERGHIFTDLPDAAQKNHLEGRRVSS